jgi:hypothetical protein
MHTIMVERRFGNQAAPLNFEFMLEHPGKVVGIIG